MEARKGDTKISPPDFLKPLGLIPIGLFVLTFLLLFVGSLRYPRRIRKKYDRLQFGGVSSCPICGERITGRKTTNNLFLFPYAFGTLRHYENDHKDISADARKARLTLTLSADFAVFSFITGAVYESIPGNAAQLPATEIAPGLALSFCFLSVIAWGIVAVVLFKVGSKEQPPGAKLKSKSELKRSNLRRHWAGILKSALILSVCSSLLMVTLLQFNISLEPVPVVLPSAYGVVTILLFFFASFGLLIDTGTAMRNVDDKYKGRLEEARKTGRHYQEWEKMQIDRKKSEAALLEKTKLRWVIPSILNLILFVYALYVLSGEFPKGAPIPSPFTEMLGAALIYSFPSLMLIGAPRLIGRHREKKGTRTTKRVPSSSK